MFVVLKTVMKTDNVGMLKGPMDLDFCVQLQEISYDRSKRFRLTLVLAFLVFNEDLETTLHARRAPLDSFTSYTRANPPYI